MSSMRRSVSGSCTTSASPGFAGSAILSRSRWANSALTRPRLSHTPARIASISAGHVGEADAIAAPDQLEHGNRGKTDDRIESLLEAASDNQRETYEARVHR